VNSRSYGIGRGFVALMRSVAEAQNAVFMDNPPLPLDLKAAGGRNVLFVIQRGDALKKQAGLEDDRTLRLLVGAVSLTQTGWQDADALHFAARTAVRTAAGRAALSAAYAGPVREVELEPELRDMVTEGVAQMSAFEIDYRQTYPNAAR